jgi:hypothetical protein
MQVYTGSCGNLVPLPGGCDDDNGPACPGLTASVTITAAVNTVYYILAGGFNTNSGTLQMTVLNPNPQVICPPNLIFSADPGLCTKSNVTYSATGSENCVSNLTVTFNPPSGSTFPKGTNTVLCTATDTSGNKAICSFTVTVLDTEAPRLICPPSLVFNTDPGTCSKSNITYTATATDNCDPSVPVYLTPPSGSTFVKGVNLVQCFTSDSSGNTNYCTFTVTVLDNQAPQIVCPGNLLFFVDPGTCSKSKVTYSATATDNCDTGVPVIFSPPSGSTFPKGTNIVQCTATDSSGNTGACTFTVTVLDVITLLCQTDRVMAATSAQGAVVHYAVVASDNCDSTLTVTSTPPSGSVLPYGTTPVACVASTASGNNTVCGFNVTVVPPSCCQGKFWSLRDVSGPGARAAQGMAYDAARGRVVLFGGAGPSGVLGDTWEWNGFSWTLMATTGPSPREFCAMAYDSRIGQTVLFGGYAQGAVTGPVADTWLWDGVTWKQLAPSNAPSARYDHAMAYDSARGRTVLFGGFNGVELGDTWEFDGAQWMPVGGGTTGPGPRTGHSLAYGSAQGQMLLFGGEVQGTNYFGDTWNWSGSAWTLLASSGPSPRAFHAAAYSDNCDSVILYGGNNGNNNLSDTWEWNGTAWTFTASNAPIARKYVALAHDSANNQTVLFGGYSAQGYLGDTWVYGPSQAPPQVLSTYAVCGDQKIVVGFSAPLDPVTAQNIGSYTLSCAGTPNPITQAVLTDDPRIVWLYTSQPLSGALTGGCCTLTINGVRDLCGHTLRQYATSVCCTNEPCSRGSAGTEYWLTFPGNYAPDPTNPPAPQLFIAGPAGVVGTVSMPGRR